MKEKDKNKSKHHWSDTKWWNRIYTNKRYSTSIPLHYYYLIKVCHGIFDSTKEHISINTILSYPWQNKHNQIKSDHFHLSFSMINNIILKFHYLNETLQLLKSQLIQESENWLLLILLLLLVGFNAFWLDSSKERP